DRTESQAQNTASPDPGYEVASVKPNNTGSDESRLIFPPDGLAATNVTPQMFIRAAYGVQDYQISGAPNWLKSEKYDIEVKMTAPFWIRPGSRGTMNSHCIGLQTRAKR